MIRTMDGGTCVFNDDTLVYKVIEGDNTVTITTHFEEHGTVTGAYIFMSNAIKYIHIDYN
jgi:hypothetical protein